MTLDERIDKLKAEHRRLFDGGAEPRAVVAPYRVCPLGAHVDHQHGTVTGMALENSVALVFSASADGRTRLKSLNFPDEKIFDVTAPQERARDWSDYARGAAAALARDTGIARGIDAVLEGDLPIGGLSSSAACGVAYLLALEAANNIDVSPEHNIELDRMIENDFIGLNNGILDQSVILLSQKHRLLHMDCRDARYEVVAPHPGIPPFDVLVVFSGVKKKLEDTDYNKRVSECEAAARRLLELAGRAAPEGRVRLRHVKPHEFEEFGERLEPNQKKRAAHFFSECGRVAHGLEAWRGGDLAKLGALMRESGVSSIENYECGCRPIIDLMHIMNDTPGVHGARFSGAGFRGSCIGLSDPRRRDAISERITEKYKQRHPEFAGEFQIHFCRMGNGAHYR